MHLEHIRKLAEDIADPWTHKFIPQLIPSLTFTRTTDALEEPDDNGLFDRLTPSPFGLRYCELSYKPLPFHSRFDNISIHRLTTRTRFLSGAMASQTVRELGLERAAFHTTRPAPSTTTTLRHTTFTFPEASRVYIPAFSNSRTCAQRRGKFSNSRTQRSPHSSRKNVCRSSFSSSLSMESGASRPA
ncbi:hypothetical protein C8R48DRAFT_778134 [Suillus tomentosus]|nr:hypothetical protein C8R48DRAFT_778134 [Suillus tomentosus]